MVFVKEKRLQFIQVVETIVFTDTLFVLSDSEEMENDTSTVKERSESFQENLVDLTATVVSKWSNEENEMSAKITAGGEFMQDGLEIPSTSKICSITSRKLEKSSELNKEEPEKNCDADLEMIQNIAGTSATPVSNLICEQRKKRKMSQKEDHAQAKKPKLNSIKGAEKGKFSTLIFEFIEKYMVRQKAKLLWYRLLKPCDETNMSIHGNLMCTRCGMDVNDSEYEKFEHIEWEVGSTGKPDCEENMTAFPTCDTDIQHKVSWGRRNFDEEFNYGCDDVNLGYWSDTYNVDNFCLDEEGLKFVRSFLENFCCEFFKFNKVEE